MIKKIGHRGAQGHETENTIASFEKALLFNVDGIELDVHSTADGEIVVFHDFTLERMTDGVGEIHKKNLADLQLLKVDQLHKIPTLQEVLHLIDKKCTVNVELKGHDTAKQSAIIIEQFVENHGWNYDQFIVSSFQRDELKKISQFNAKIPLAVLTQASVEQAVEWAEEFNAKAIHPHFSLLTRDNCHFAKSKGFQINTWTVNAKTDIERLKTYEIDGIISDFPDRI